MTVAQERQQIISGLSRVEQKVDDLKELVVKQNSRISTNENDIQGNSLTLSKMQGQEKGEQLSSQKWNNVWKVIMTLSLVVLTGLEIWQRWGN